MDKLMEDIICTADSFTKNFGEDPIFPFIKKGSFDYSVESLKVVDQLLEELSSYEPDEDGICNLASMVGCYIFETARKNYGGEYYWIEKEQQPVLIAGLPDLQISIRAWEKVKGRLINGKEDDIPFYIAGYKEHVEHGKKGDFIMIV